MDFPDALAGSVLAAKRDGVILLTRAKPLEGCVKTYLQDKEIDSIAIFGGKGVVSLETEEELKEFIK